VASPRIGMAEKNNWEGEEKTEGEKLVEWERRDWQRDKFCTDGEVVNELGVNQSSMFGREGKRLCTNGIEVRNRAAQANRRLVVIETVRKGEIMCGEGWGNWGDVASRGTRKMGLAI
jgi:hypothetical protein